MGDDMSASLGIFTYDFFTFLGSDVNNISVTQGTLSCWVNGPSVAAEILELYSIHKEECRHYVDAASSFVLYDAERNLVLVARDFFGSYPLYYTEVGNDLIISFSAKAIAESKRVTLKINAATIVNYLNWDTISNPITNQTFYQNLYSLLPGHALLREQGQTTIKPYAQLNLEKYASLTDDEYIRQFKDFFIRSVQKTIAPYSTIATHLSGGLDSSSVCSVAQSLSTKPVHSFYIQTDTPAAQEEVYVEAVLEKWAQKGQPIIHENIQPDEDVYADVVKSTSQVGQPSQLLLPISTFLPIIERARKTGCDILLSGHCGDQMLGYGFEYLDDLFQKQDWKTLKVAIANYADKRILGSLAARESFKNVEQKRRAYTLYFFIQKLKQAKNINRWSQALAVLFTQFNCGVSDVVNFLRNRQNRKKEPPVPALTNWFRDDNERTKSNDTTHTLDIMQLVAGTPSALQKEQIGFFFGSLGIQFNEEIDQLHAHYSLKTAHPFLDKNLLELTLNTPSRLRFGAGLGRDVLRKGLEDYLPEKIANRVDKGEFSEYAHNAFYALHSEFIKHTIQTHPVWEIVDRTTFDDAVGIIFDEKYTIKQKNPYRFVATRVIYLAIWLNYVNAISA